MTDHLTIEQKGTAMAAIDQLVRALAFPENGAGSFRLAAKQLAAGSREVTLSRLATRRDERVSRGLDPALSDLEILDIVFCALGTTT